MSARMDHRRRLPEDLMGTILGEASGASGEEGALSGSRGSRGTDQVTGSPSSVSEGPVSWEKHPERVGITFNLSKQLSAELDELRLELEEDVRPSRSELAEEALRIAVEDVRERGRASELVKRLRDAAHSARDTDAADEGGPAVWRSVDEVGFVIETTYDANGEIVDEAVVARVAELPVETEYLDEKGRLVSLAKDELGNTFEQIMDKDLNILGTRLLPSAR